MGLALLSLSQTAHLASESAVWAQAQRIAPTVPDAWIHGAMAALDRGEFGLASIWLREARDRVPQQSPREHAWATDAIDATQAVIYMREGRLRDAAQLMAGAPIQTARGELCTHFRSVCALAD